MQLLILERDTHDPLESNGAIFLETYTKLAKNSSHAIERARSFGDTHGQIWVANVDFITPIESIGNEEMKPQVVVPHALINEVKEKLGKELLGKLPFELVDDIPF